MTEMSKVMKEIAGKMRVVAGPAPVPQKTYCKPDCPICHGALWVRQDLPVDHPDFGKLVPCPNADLFTIYGSRTGIDETERGLSWSSIVDREDSNVFEAVQTVQYILQKGYGWVVLHGGYGLAKTLLLKIATVENIKAGRLSAYARMAEVIENMRKAYDTESPQAEAESRLNFWAGLPLLCLDEFDRVRSTPFETEKRFVLKIGRAHV